MVASTPREPASPRQAFTFYAANGQIYVSNVKQKLIALGPLIEEDQGYGYVLDGNQQTGHGLPSPEAALRHVADNIQFLYLDGQFTALADVRDTVDLDGAARIEVVLDELPSGEGMQDARA